MTSILTTKTTPNNEANNPVNQMPKGDKETHHIRMIWNATENSTYHGYPSEDYWLSEPRLHSPLPQELQRLESGVILHSAGGLPSFRVWSSGFRGLGLRVCALGTIGSRGGIVGGII